MSELNDAIGDQLGKGHQFNKILLRWLPATVADMGEAKLMCYLMSLAFAERDKRYFNSPEFVAACNVIGLDDSAVKRLYYDGVRQNVDPRKQARDLIQAYENGEGISRERYEAAKQYLAEF